MSLTDFVVYSLIDIKTRIFLYAVMFILGTVFGSFLNVCILRTPLGESISKEPSHCMSCGKKLHWYELIPLFSWLFLRGKCHGCKAKISGQYPFVEGATGLFFTFSFWYCIDRVVQKKIASSTLEKAFALSYTSSVITTADIIDFVLICALFCALLVLTFIDARTHEIPNGTNLFIGILGLIRVIVKIIPLIQEGNLKSEIIDIILGPIIVAGVLLLILILSGGGAIGGGDVKLMAAAGLFLGCKATLLALVIGCIAGSVIHIALMKIKHIGREVAMGPYLSLGIIVSVLCGDYILPWYIGLFKG